MSTAIAELEDLRPRLFRLAYRMLGSRQEAEDAVQEAFLRWHRSDTAKVRSPEAWLVTALSRICIDRLRVLSAEREAYIGPWLPEPLVEDAPPPDHALDLASDVSMALFVVLERLAPEERAAFLMHDVFDCGYSEIASALGKSEAACRQLVHRARERVRRERPRFKVSEASHRRLVEAYVKAIQERDAQRIAALLAPDAVFVSDGGGKTWAALRPVLGRERIARMEVGVLRKLPGRFNIRLTSVNGRAGAVSLLDGQVFSVTSFDTDGQCILSVMRILNPEKLRHLPFAPSRED
ncbi:MAG: RNA polymerase subunit sigma-24 [Proteobacteria bacterium]|mgnify:CR=1 FL=1|jgi:RNA polymerase sigma-70 factor (ECF subfamily)|nr:MAG: RNA polymerase subunit sigma-24 [Pseudomonadota bacterium]